MSAVTVRALVKSYGDQPVLRGLDLDVPEGSITAVLGSSGCGKSTLLRIIAGFVRPGAGTVTVGDREVEGPRSHVAPQRRGVGYVPQEGALFPHLTVARNITFGLPRAERRGPTLDRLLELIELPRDLADRYPHELSGGQQQRVALARALAPGPSVVLLDEPFSSLDAGLRVSAGRTVARVLRHAGATALLVTHDQGEALSLADRVAVMREGRFVQVGSPDQVYDAPVDAVVARFVGGGSSLEGMVRGVQVETELGALELAHPFPDGPAVVVVRPEQLEVHDLDEGVAATVIEVDYYGAQVVVLLELPSGAQVTARGPAARPPRPNDKVGVVVVGTVRAYPDGDVR
ncbi:MAG TPA: ABC transporter ATP-binding protein [Nocardioides sp.]|nr:ABC transporter ATP-binding protein [Nocardioides sp.]